MRRKVGVVDSDYIYIKRFSEHMKLKYPGDIELYTYSSEEEASKGIKNIYFDVLLIAEEMSRVRSMVPKGTAVLILTAKNNIEEIEGISAVSKYRQKISDIYNEIQAAYAAVSKQENVKKKRQNKAVTLVMSCQGGCGTSTVAAAYAFRKAQEGNSVFYLPLDLFGDVSLFFTGDGRRSFTDVINGVKKGVNLDPVIKSSVKNDASGVSFFDTCQNAYDMVELNELEVGTLIKTLCTYPYDDIIISYSSKLDERMLLLLKQYCDHVIYVGDGSAIGNIKFKQFCEALSVIEQKEEVHVMNKMKLLYNRFSSKTGTTIEETAVPVMGGIPRIIMEDDMLLMKQIAQIDTVKW